MRIRTRVLGESTMARDACSEFGETSADLWATGRVAAEGRFEFDTWIDIVDFGKDGIDGGIALGEVSHRVDQDVDIVAGKDTGRERTSDDGAQDRTTTQDLFDFFVFADAVGGRCGGRRKGGASDLGALRDGVWVGGIGVFGVFGWCVLPLLFERSDVIGVDKEFLETLTG